MIKLKPFFKKAFENPKTFIQANKTIIKNSEKNMDKKIIESAIAHLNGYVLILESKFIPALAVKETIKGLQTIKKENLK